MSKDLDLKFLKKAIENSRESFKQGNFPAGSILVKDGEIIASEVSSPYPGLLHADSKAVNTAFNKVGRLTGATLYVGLEPCLMCTGVAYWGGIRRIVFSVTKDLVSPEYYETPVDTSELRSKFNDKIEFVHLSELQDQALYVIREWEEEYLKK